MEKQGLYMGIDVGVGSLGIALIYKSKEGKLKIIDGTSFIFLTAKSKKDRRKFRNARTQNQRTSKRIENTRIALANLLGVDKDLDRTNIKHSAGHTYVQNTRNTSLIQYRDKSSRQKCTPQEIFLALMHIAKNRGIRLTKDSSSSKEYTDKTAKEMESSGFTTIGQYLYNREKKGLGTKIRHALGDAKNVPFLYTRHMIKNEIDIILKEQQKHYPDIFTESVCDEILDSTHKDYKDASPLSLLWEQQPDLKKLQDNIGTCCYEIKADWQYDTHPEKNKKGEYTPQSYEKRLPIASALFQQKRLLEQLNNLRLRQRGKFFGENKGKLTLEQRKDLYNFILYSPKDGKNAKQILKQLGYTDDLTPTLNLDKNIKGDQVYHAIKKHAKILAEIYKNAPNITEKEKIINVLQEDDLNELEKSLVHIMKPTDLESEFDNICKISLPTGYSNIGITATQKIYNQLKQKVISTKEAESILGLRLRSGGTGETLKHLPYYGQILQSYCRGGTYNAWDKQQVQYGEISNSVVHSALIKIQKTVNQFIDKHGVPEYIHLEMSRDLRKTEKERKDIERKNKKNKEYNEKFDEIIKGYKKKPSRKYRRALKLHEWQKGVCPFTGDCMAIDDIFNGKAVIEHLLPRSQTADDSLSNIVLSMAYANNKKGNSSPYEAFGGGFAYNGRHITYDEILKRIEEYPASKKAKFTEDAMDKFKEKNDFLKRFESDTAYLARVAKQYLSCLYGTDKNIKVLAGGITKEMRHQWGVANVLSEINDKNLQDDAKKDRSDHRHHLLDAIVIACTTQSEIQRWNKYVSGKKWKKDKKLEPKNWKGFRHDVKKFLNNPALVVRHKTIHTAQGQLHRETHYRIIAEYITDKTALVSVKQDFDSLLNIRINNNDSNESVAKAIKAHILTDKNYNAYKQTLQKELSLGTLNIPKISKENPEKLKIHVEKNIIRDLDNLIKMRDNIITLYEQQPKKKWVENPKENEAEKIEVDNTAKEKLYDAIKAYQNEIEKKHKEKIKNKIAEYEYKEKTENIKDTLNALYAAKKQSYIPRKFPKYDVITPRVIVNKRQEQEFQTNIPYRPSRVYETNSNSHVEVYKDKKGKIQSRTISKIDALAPHYKQKRCAEMQENGENPLCELRAGDEFIFTCKKTGIERIFYLHKMSKSLTFVAIECVSNPDKLKGGETSDIHFDRKLGTITNTSLLENYKIQRIYRNNIGDIKARTTIE